MPFGNSINCACASASCQCFAKAVCASSVVASATSMRLAMPGLSIFDCNWPSGTKAVYGGICEACRLNRPNCRSVTTAWTLSWAIDTVASSIGAIGASRESCDGLCTRRLMTLPFLTLSCRANRSLSTTASSGISAKSGCSSASFQNAASTPMTTTLLARASPDGRLAKPGSCSVAAVAVCNSSARRLAKSARKRRSPEGSASCALPRRAAAMSRRLPRTDSPTSIAPTNTIAPTATPSSVPKWLRA